MAGLRGQFVGDPESTRQGSPCLPISTLTLRAASRSSNRMPGPLVDATVAAQGPTLEASRAASLSPAPGLSCPF